jgi:3-phenylpropionate/cinnamic acid dioxygenase small subunit
MTLEARLRRLEDIVAIRDATSKYNRAIDDNEPEVWLDSFTADGQFEIHGVVTLSGHSQLGGLPQAVDRCTVHVTGDPVIEIDGDKAMQYCRLPLFRRNNDLSPGDFMASGHYVDNLERCSDNVWRFKSRSCYLDADLVKAPGGHPLRTLAERAGVV